MDLSFKPNQYGKLKLKKKKTQINYSEHVKSTTQFILKNNSK
jgi:hypothetical protein